LRVLPSAAETIHGQPAASRAPTASLRDGAGATLDTSARPSKAAATKGSAGVWSDLLRASSNCAGARSSVEPRCHLTHAGSGPTMLQLREFLYLNPQLVEQFVGQVEDGLYDEEAEREQRARDGKGKLGGGPISVEGGTGSQTETSRTVRQTPESRFNRLSELINSQEDLLISVDESATGLYGRFVPGRLVDATCYVDVPSMGRFLAQTQELDGLAQLMEVFAPNMIDEEAAKAIQGIRAIGNRFSGSVVATGEVREGEPTLVFKLATEHLRVAIGDLEGEAHVFGVVHRRWPEGERYPLIAVPGLELMSRTERREMARSGQQQTEDDGAYLDGPGVTISVVAIYR
jgi:hypothetical protein